MAADGEHLGTGPYPFACRRRWIEVIDCAAGGAGAVERLARGSVGTVGDRLVELSVVKAGECALLIDNARKRIRERGMIDTVEDDGSDRHLTDIRLSSCLRGNEPRQQVNIAVGARACARFFIDAQSRERLVTCLAVNGKTVCALEILDRALGAAAVYSIYGAVVIAPAFQARLYLGDSSPRRAALVQFRVRLLRKGDYQYIYGKYQCDRKNEFFMLDAQ